MADDQSNETVHELRKIRFLLKQILVILSLLSAMLGVMFFVYGYARWAESVHR